MENNNSEKVNWKVLRKIDENYCEAAVVISRSGNVVYTSESMETVLGYTPENTLGQVYLDFIDQEEWYIARMIASTSFRRTKGFLHAELKLNHADGETIYCNLRIENLLNDPDIEGMIVYVRQANEKEPEQIIDQVSRHAVIARDLPGAVEREELLLHYQPKVNLKTGKVNGVEALIRWQHPELGLIYPNELIPVAEELGEIIPIGNWVIFHACEQNKKWQLDGYPPMVISVNLSMQQFSQDNLFFIIADILYVTHLSPRYLELEITESMTANVSHTMRTLQRLKSLGLRISIDDFGTGYSNLNHLKNFPADVLKIDKSFIVEITQNPIDKAIVKTIINLAHDLGLETVAEGIEKPEHLEFLKTHFCAVGQGYLFSKPVDAKKLIETIDLIESSFVCYTH